MLELKNAGMQKCKKVIYCIIFIGPGIELILETATVMICKNVIKN
jgi:hypothetical protein